MSVQEPASILGLPLDENSSFLGGTALAPPTIRRVLQDGAMNLCTEAGVDLATAKGWQDEGDLQLSAGMEALAQIEQAVAERLLRGRRVLSLGGDHSVTYPILRAYGKRYPDLTILHLDAHPDLYDEFEGSRISHACPFARIMEERLAAQVVQVGIRAMTPHQHFQAERFGVRVIQMQDWYSGMRLGLDGPLYLSLDLDALDPACAPGVSHHEPGGFTTREVLRVLQGLDSPLVGADIVEFNPRRDLMDMTARLAAKLTKEILGKMLEIT